MRERGGEGEKVRERMSLLHILTYFCRHALAAAFAFNNERRRRGLKDLLILAF